MGLVKSKCECECVLLMVLVSKVIIIVNYRTLLFVKSAISRKESLYFSKTRMITKQ